MRVLPFLVVPTILAACSGAETTAMIEDPSAFLCREIAVGQTSASFEETTARPISTDIFGTQTYEATGAGQTFQCIIDDEGELISSRRI